MATTAGSIHQPLNRLCQVRADALYKVGRVRRFRIDLMRPKTKEAKPRAVTKMTCSTAINVLISDAG